MAFETTKQIKFVASVDGADKVKAGFSGIRDGMLDTQRASALLRNSFAGLATAAGVGVFAEMVNGAIDAKAKLYDLGLQTGISVEALGGLAKVARFSNTSLDEIAGASAKLSKALATNNEDSKGAAQAIKALGLEYASFKALGADEQLLAVAQAMQGFADGTGKTAAAMLLFGKTGATLLPFLNELAERGLMVTRQTTESARAAKQYQDNLVALRGAGEGLSNQIAGALLPGLVALTDELVTLKGESAEVGAAAAGLRVAFETLAILGANVAFVFGGIGRELGAIGAQGAALARGDFAGIGVIADAVIADGKRARAELDAFEQRLLGVRAMASAGGGRGFVNPAGPRRPDLDIAPTPEKAKAAHDDYTPLLKQIAEKTALEQAQLAGTRELTEAQKLQAKVFADIDGGYVSLTLDQKLRIDQLLQELLGVEALNVAYAAEAKWLDQANKETVKTLEAQDQRLQSVQDEVAAAQQQLDAYGLTRAELQALERARTLDSAALLRQRAAVLDSTGPMGELRQLYLDQAAALEHLVDIKGTLAGKEARDRNDPTAGAANAVRNYLDEVKAAGLATERVVGDAMRGLEDGLTEMFTKGRWDARNFIDTLIAEFIRLRVVKPLLADIFGGGGSGGGLLGDLFGGLGSLLGFRATGGPVQAGAPYIVGERGPEVFVPQSAGVVVPNGVQAGNRVTLTYAPQIHIDSRSDRAQVAQQTAVAVQAGNRQLLEMLHARGLV